MQTKLWISLEEVALSSAEINILKVAFPLAQPNNNKLFNLLAAYLLCMKWQQLLYSFPLLDAFLRNFTHFLRNPFHLYRTVCVSVFLSVCVSVSLAVCLSLCLCLCPSVSVSALSGLNSSSTCQSLHGRTPSASRRRRPSMMVVICSHLLRLYRV